MMPGAQKMGGRFEVSTFTFCFVMRSSQNFCRTIWRSIGKERPPNLCISTRRYDAPHFCWHDCNRSHFNGKRFKTLENAVRFRVSLNYVYHSVLRMIPQTTLVCGRISSKPVAQRVAKTCYFCFKRKRSWVKDGTQSISTTTP